MQDVDNLIRAKAQRQLKYLRNFKINTDNVWVYEGISLQSGERILGNYENSQADSPKNIVVSTRGLHLQYIDSSWEFISYGNIQSVSSQNEGKHVAKFLIITLHNSELKKLVIEGGDNKYRDAWGMLSFLKNAVRISKKHP